MDNSRTVPAPPPEGITLVPEAWELSETNLDPYEWTIPPAPRTPTVPRTGPSRRLGLVIAGIGAVVLGAVVAIAVDRLAVADADTAVSEPEVAVAVPEARPTFELGALEVAATRVPGPLAASVPSTVHQGGAHGAPAPDPAAGLPALVPGAVDPHGALEESGSDSLAVLEIEVPPTGMPAGVLSSITSRDAQDSVFGARQGRPDSQLGVRQGRRGSRTARRPRSSRQRSVVTTGPEEARAPAPAVRRRRYLSGGDVAPVVARSQRRLQQCYGTALRRSGVARAVAVRLLIAIAPTGQVASARVEGDAPPQLVRCLEGVARRWTFPESRHGAEVPVPLRFSPDV